MTDDFVLSFLLSAFSLEIANFAEKKKDYIIIELEDGSKAIIKAKKIA